MWEPLGWIEILLYCLTFTALALAYVAGRLDQFKIDNGAQNFPFDRRSFNV